MLNEVFNFDGMFSKIGAGMCRLDMHGRTAVKTSNGYKTYDLKKRRLINCASFCFDVCDEMFFVIPTNHVEIGDIILVNKLPKCVIKVDDDVITVINYENSVIESIVPERHIFMSETYFYGKIVSLMSGIFNGGNAMQNIIQFKIMNQLMGGKGGSLFGGTGEGGLNNLLPFMLMNNNGGGFNFGNMLGNMFDGLFGNDKKGKKPTVITEDIDDDEDEEDTEEEEEVVIKPVKKATKKATKKEA